jgi:dCTP deaminase
MILTGSEIKKQVEHGMIVIDPFEEEQINPNSYNYRLGDDYSQVPELLSLGHSDQDESFQRIPEDGLQLEPGIIYLANTYETIGSSKYVTLLIGRSSVARLGLFLQISADLGNLGPAHKWTLELTCVQPIIVYPRMKIGQVSFWVPAGDIREYSGAYTAYDVPKHSIYDLLLRDSQ